MEDRKVKELLVDLEAYRLELSQDVEASKQFLIGAGIINSEGKLQENYKNLCTPQERA